MTHDLSRREAIRIGAAATVAASVATSDTLIAQSAFFTKEELALVDELSEIIIPADDHSPGARAARVAADLDRRLADDWEQSDRTAWREGLALIERLSREMHGHPFLESSMPERIALLTRMAQNEGKPQKPEEVFFAELKSKVVHAYYTSEIGIKQEIEYKGNTYQTEFAGFD